MRAIERWVFDAYAAALPGLAVVRVAWAAAVLLFAVPRPNWTNAIPAELYNPPPGLPAGWFALLGGPAPAWLSTPLSALLAASAVLVGFGWRTNVATVVAVACGVTLNAWTYATGKIDHDLLLWLTPALLAVAGWGHFGSVDAKLAERRGGLVPEPADNATGRAWAVAMLAFLIAVLMLTAAVQKVRGGWLDLDRLAVLRHVLLNQDRLGRETIAGDLALDATPAWLWELQDWATIAFEGAFVFALVKLGWFRVVCAIAVFFHVGVWLTMSIFFVANLVAYAAFADWRLIRERHGVVVTLENAVSGTPRFVVGVVALAAAIAAALLDRPLATVDAAPGSAVSLGNAVQALAAAIAVAAAAWCLISMVAGYTPRSRRARRSNH